jgi:DNA-binding NarL/FixJ family response regulator
MWSRWKLGQSLHEIGRAFGKEHGVIHFMLAQRGGIAPAVRHRSLRTLTLAEREEISRGIASGGSIREIAKGLKRAVSTVSRSASLGVSLATQAVSSCYARKAARDRCG